MKRRRKLCAVLLAFAMVVTSAVLPDIGSSAAKKKPKISVDKKNISLQVGKTAALKVTTKNVKKIKSVKAVSSKKAYIKVIKVKRSKKSAQIKVKARKAQKANIKITIKYVPAGSSKAKKKKLTVKVTGKKKIQPSQTPVVIPTKAPDTTKVPSVEPAPEEKKKVNITSIQVEDLEFFETAIRVSFSDEVKLKKADVSVKKKEYNSTETKACTVNAVTQTAAREYRIFLGYSGVLDYGDEVTVSIPSLTGDVKAMSTVAKSKYDGTTQEYNVSGINSGFSFHIDGNNTYHLVGKISVSETTEKWPGWFSATATENEGCVCKVGEIEPGLYQIPVKFTDEIGTSVTVVMNILIGSEDEIRMKDTKVEKKIRRLVRNVWNLEVNRVVGGPEVDEGNKYAVSAERTSGESEEELQWEVSEDGKLQVTGLIDVDQTWKVTVKSAVDDTISAVCTVSFVLVAPIKVSGKMMNTAGEPVEADQVCFRNTEDGQESVTYVAEDGTYKLDLYPGTYQVSAYVTIGNTPYYSGRENLTVKENSDPIQNIDITFDLAMQKVTFEKSKVSAISTPAEYNVVSFRDWYSDEGEYVGYGSSIKLLPGKYTLHCPIVRLYKEDDDGDYYIGSATASFTVTDTDLTVDAVITNYKSTVYKNLSMDGTKEEINPDECVEKVFSFTMEQEGYCKFSVVDSGDVSYRLYAKVFDENFKYIGGVEDVANNITLKLKAGKYYIMNMRILDIQKDGYYAKIEKLEGVTVSGKLTDESGQSLGFDSENLPEVYSYIAGKKVYGTVNTDGSYSLEALQNSMANIRVRMPDGNEVYIQANVLEEDLENQDIQLFVIHIQPDSGYQTRYTCEFHAWYDVMNCQKGEGSVLYFDGRYSKDQTLHCRVTVKNNITNETEDLYAEFTHFLSGSETVTATIGTWEPANVTEITLNSSSQTVTKSTWYKFVAAEEGWYKVQADLTEDTSSTPCDVFDRFHIAIECWDNVWDENDERYGTVYYLKAGETYYISEWDMNGEPFQVRVEKYNMPEENE